MSVSIDIYRRVHLVLSTSLYLFIRHFSFSTCDYLYRNDIPKLFSPLTQRAEILSVTPLHWFSNVRKVLSSVFSVSYEMPIRTLWCTLAPLPFNPSALKWHLSSSYTSAVAAFQPYGACKCLQFLKWSIGPTLYLFTLSVEQSWDKMFTHDKVNFVLWGRKCGPKIEKLTLISPISLPTIQNMFPRNPFGDGDTFACVKFSKSCERGATFCSYSHNSIYPWAF